MFSGCSMTAGSVVHMTSVHSALDHRIFGKECRSLARAGFEVTIVGPHPEDTTSEQVKIKSVLKEKRRLARMTRTAWRVYTEARKQNADVYHFHDPELIPVAILLRVAGKTVIYDVHEDFPKDMVATKSYLPKWSRQMVGWLVGRMESMACRQFSAVVTATPLIAERLRPENSRTIILFNYPPQELVALASESNWAARKKAVSYIGTFMMQRGIGEMMEAMLQLPASLNATLEIMGANFPEELRRHPGWARVNYHGGLEPQSMFRVLQGVRAGLVIHHPVPTFVESIPVKMFEYMAAGLPLIASDFPLWRKMLQGIECTIFVNPLNSKQIAEAIEYVMTHDREAEEMGRRGQAAVHERFNWNTQAEKLIDLYSGLVGHACAG